MQINMAPMMKPRRSNLKLAAGIASVALGIIVLVGLTTSANLGSPVSAKFKTSSPSRVVCHSKVKKIDLAKQGLNSVEDPAIQANLQGRSRAMENKNWIDSQGRKGRGFGVYRFSNKYGANVDGYSPIYTPDIWAESGNSYKLGTNALVAWAALVLVLLAVGANLIVSTSQLQL
ncbi:hypothetical protein AAMO2058_000984800 [Amorphochlora amoebiformis]